MSSARVGNTWDDELLKIDRVVRDGLGVVEGETIEAAARRIVGEGHGGPRVEAASALLAAREARDTWGGMRVAAAILGRGEGRDGLDRG